ncbi:MAG: hypothetical protein GX986_10685 [Firmicutes bacterium]|nr:hypothetical protein [Bacillota bacterium]
MQKLRDLRTNLPRLVPILEAWLSAFVIVAILIGVLDLTKYLKLIFESEPSQAYDIFQQFLGHVLILVIGLELVTMLVRHNPGSIIEVLVFAIARKLLVSSQTSTDMLIGIVALGALFAVRRYLFVHTLSDAPEAGYNLGAATKVKDVNRIVGTFISEDTADTIGGLLALEATKLGKPLRQGMCIHIADAKLTIVQMRDGLIEKVNITRLD